MLEQWKTLLEKAKKLNSEATSPPWSWFGNTKTKDLYLATVDRGRQFVMQFCRWGMSSGQPMFQVPNTGDAGVMKKASEMVKYEVEYREDIIAIDHPDARMLAEGRNLFAELVEALEGALAKLASTTEPKVEKAPPYPYYLRFEVRAYLPGKDEPCWKDIVILDPAGLKQTRAPATEMARGALLAEKILGGVSGVIASVQYDHT